MRTPSASVLVEPLDAYLGRRARSASPLAPGEAVTIAVGLLRGCRQATGRLTGARWWLRADGCPVAVEEDESPDAIAATSAVLERLATMASDHPTREVLARARESVLTQPPRDWDALEHRLFQHAAPHPLILGPLTPVERELPPPIDPVTAGSGTRVLAFIDADLAESVGEVISDLRARWRSSRALRMGVVGAAATLVAVVCVLAWPQPVTPDASAPGVPSTTAADVADPDVADPDITPPRRQASPLPPATDSVASGAEPSHASDGAPLDDPVASARALFALSDGCNGDVSCLASFVEDADSLGDRLLPGAATADVGLIDDFGDVAVVRLSRDAQLQYVTLVRQEDRWLVRAVETVADQPS